MTATISQCKEDLRTNTQKAVLSCRRYVNCDPNDPGALSYLGQANRALGRLPAAQEAFQQELALAQNRSDDDSIARAHHNLALVLLEQSSLDQAETEFRKSLEINSRKNNFVGLGANYKGLGDVYFQRGDLSNSESYFQKALDLEEKIGNELGEGDAYVGLGYLNIKRGDRSAGCSYLQRAHAAYVAASNGLRVEQADAHLKKTGCA